MTITKIKPISELKVGGIYTFFDGEIFHKKINLHKSIMNKAIIVKINKRTNSVFVIPFCKKSLDDYIGMLSSLSFERMNNSICDAIIADEDITHIN